MKATLPAESMRILLTNITLASRTGTEIVTRDLALGFLAKGHRPTVYTPDPGAIALEIESAGVPVIRNLAEIGQVPDVIHGHHLVECLSALLHFPNTPCIFVCHDRLIWHDAPPPVEQVNRFVAVDRNCLERLVLEAGIPESKTRLIYNAVDLAKFRPRPPLPEKPQTALIFSNNARAGTHLEPVRDACRLMGITLDVVGAGMNTGSDVPEWLLANYDLVFAKARCALEAMAVGCAVVLCDARGMGGLVTAKNVSELREWNFGMRCLHQPATPAAIVQEILRYDSSDAAHVSKYIRSEASLDRTLDQYIGLYREVLEEDSDSLAPLQTENAIRAIAKRSGELEGRLRSSQRLFMPPLSREIGQHIDIRFADPLSGLTPGCHVAIKVHIRNASGEILSSLPPHPVCCSYHWLSPLTREPVVFEGQRTALTAPIRAGSVHEQAANIIAPDHAGEFILRMTLVQEGVFWMDQLDPPLAVESLVSVKEEALAGQSSSENLAVSLRQASHWHRMTVVRDGEFSNLCFANDTQPRALCFVESEAFVSRVRNDPNVACVITTAALANSFPERLGIALCEFPRRAFADAHNFLASNTSFYWREFPSEVHHTAKIHPRSFVADVNVIIGANTIVHPNATVLENTILGDNVEVFSGAVLGSIGFQTISTEDGIIDLTHAGGIRIGDGSQILANAVIARGVFRQFTTLATGVRVGNSAFISHNTNVGANSFIGHGAVVNGNVKIGENAWIGPGATIVHSIAIGDHAHVSFGSAVMRDVATGERVIGSIALPQRKMLRLMGSLNK